MSLSLVVDKTVPLKPTLKASGVSAIQVTTDALTVTASSGIAKADPAFGRSLALGKDWYPDALGGFQPTVPGAARPAQYGTGPWPNWTASQSDVYTLASDPASIPLLFRTTGEGANPTGILVSPTNNRQATAFRVQSLDATGAYPTSPDLGTFDFVLLNPSW